MTAPSMLDSVRLIHVETGQITNRVISASNYKPGMVILEPEDFDLNQLKTNPTSMLKVNNPDSVDYDGNVWLTFGSDNMLQLQQARSRIEKGIKEGKIRDVEHVGEIDRPTSFTVVEEDAPFQFVVKRKYSPGVAKTGSAMEQDVLLNLSDLAYRIYRATGCDSGIRPVHLYATTNDAAKPYRPKILLKPIEGASPRVDFLTARIIGLFSTLSLTDRSQIGIDSIDRDGDNGLRIEGRDQYAEKKAAFQRAKVMAERIFETKEIRCLSIDGPARGA